VGPLSDCYSSSGSNPTASARDASEIFKKLLRIVECDFGGRASCVCEGFRVPSAFLDDAVIDGIQKRIDLVLDPEELRRRLSGMLSQESESADAVPKYRRASLKRVGGSTASWKR